MSAVSVRDLAISAVGRMIVGPLTFELPVGATMGLRGPSGAGKSTVLRTLVGLLPTGLTAAGAVTVLGADVTDPGTDFPALRAQAVLVGQTPVVFPGSVLANATLGIRHVLRAPKAELRERARSALVEVGLWEEVADRLDEPADQLSVGQRQRLCLARALALGPALLLLDEPTSALDAHATQTVETTIAGLRGRRTVLVVSHDLAQLTRMCDTVVTVSDQARPGTEGAAVLLT